MKTSFQKVVITKFIVLMSAGWGLVPDLLLAQTAPSSNLILNGGFETWNAPTHYLAGSQLDSWTIGGGVYLMDTAYPGADSGAGVLGRSNSRAPALLFRRPSPLRLVRRIDSPLISRSTPSTCIPSPTQEPFAC